MSRYKRRKIFRNRRKTLSIGNSRAEIIPIVKLWVIRILVLLGGSRFINGDGFFFDEEIAVKIGMKRFKDEDGFFDADEFKRDLISLHIKMEDNSSNITAPKRLINNLKRLAETTGLTDTECKILEFIALATSDPLLEETTDLLGRLPASKIVHVLSTILNLPKPEINSALRADSTLIRTGLVKFDRRDSYTLTGSLDLLSDDFADKIIYTNSDPINLLREIVFKSTPAQLKLTNFSHLNPQLTMLRHYLKKIAANKQTGVNVFLHGAPGTGKTQLSKILARDLKCKLYEVSSENFAGDPINGEDRLRALNASQNFLKNQQTLLLFDEAEDVFYNERPFSSLKSIAQTRKAWINRILEGNHVPTIWISNNIESIDPAFMRRFDMIIHLPVPPKKQREALLHKHCGELVDSKTLSRIAELENLAPALVTKAAYVVNTVRDDIGAENTASTIELLLNTTLEAQGHKPVRKSDPNRLPDIYDPAFINADADLAAITKGLAYHKSGRLCLFGPPGTGKTAYARWLANELGMVLLVKRASDLKSPYVGETAKRIAKSFREAEQQGALLLIDEVDGFLQDRRGATRNFEITEVNEMLTQMESFGGIFIASTNLMNGLDQAALRRFDLKARFDYLRPEQAWRLFCSYCDSLGFTKPSDLLHTRLSNLPQLTPGDFATAIRQNRFRKIESASSFVEILEAECALKDGKKVAIGFV